ncbi:MAG: hypothetical protein AAGI30_10770 [Planctomycetota bacterium]
MRLRTRHLALLFAFVAPTPAGGQELVDAGVEDLDLLAVSLRVELASPFRADADFSRLYEDPSDPDRLIRRDGAITVSFPRSQYVFLGGAALPVIPADAVFFIGDRREAASTEFAEPSTRLSPIKLTIQPLARRAGEPRPPALPELVRPTITEGRVVADEARRRVRLRELRHHLGPA